jgi:hypothetical protein
MLALKQLWRRYLLAQVLELKLEQVKLELAQQLVQEFVLQA